MKTLFCQYLLAFSAIFSNFTLYAVDMLEFGQNVAAMHAQDPGRSTLIGIFESCGNTTNLDDNCVLQGLDRVAREEDNTTAQAIIADYNKALAIGNAESPECQTQTHRQANRIIGHCLLLLNFYTLQNDQDNSTNKFETCLQGGMLGLTYQGNIVAQYFMMQLFEQKGISSAAKTWQNALEVRKNSSEYELLMKCYH